MKPKVLNILPFLPWPLATGGHKGCFHSIDAMRKEFDFFLLFPFENNQVDIDLLKEKWPDVTFIPYHRSAKIKPWLRLKMQSAIHKMKRIMYHGYDEPIEWNFELDSERYEDGYLNLITDTIEKESIDVVQVEFPFMLSLVLWLPNTVKKVFVHHELRFVRNELILESKKGHSLYYDFYQRKSKNEEISLLNKYDQVITFSPIDRDKLIEAGVTVPCYASFLIVDQQPKQEFIPANNKVTFLGAGGHMPNATGLRWFLDAEWNNIVNINPDIKLVIVGKWSTELQSEFKSKYKNVEFKGFVPNLKDELSGSVMIVPLTIGSGIRIKILECTSLNVPFVTTSVGVEGLPFKDGQECLIGDTTEIFKDKLIKVLSDKQLQESIASNAYDIVSEKYSQKAFVLNRMTIYNELKNV